MAQLIPPLFAKRELSHSYGWGSFSVKRGSDPRREERAPENREFNREYGQKDRMALDIPRNLCYNGRILRSQKKVAALWLRLRREVRLQ